MKNGTLGLSVILILLNGCGSSSTTESNSTQVGTSAYIDSAVKGVDYSCGSQSGTTDENGTFTYEVGQTCKMSLGSLPLRTLEVEDLIDGKSFYETNNSVAQILQSVDDDGNASNGIAVKEEIVSAITSASITEFPSTTAKLSELTSIVESIPLTDNSSRNFLTTAETQTHLDGVATVLLRELISGNTYYVTVKDANNSFIDKIVVNDAVTSEVITRVVGSNSGTVSSDTINLNGIKFEFPSRSSYVTLVIQRKEYLLFNNFADDGTARGQVRLYFSQADGQAYLDE